MINNGFMYWIFFTLSKMIYSVIPGLYDAFEFFGTYEFFDLDTDIRIIWGNLYVLLSVLVLFAIAIKLINAIVNPDVLTDKKNGVKKVYFKAFIAVFLTILTPYMFTLLVHIQDNMFKNQTIQKIFYNTTDKQNTGKVIAWTAITSFIDLNALENNTDYDLDTSALNGTAGRTYVLSEEIDQGLDEIYASQPWQHTDTVPQHPILMLAAGIFIAYEFILLVMDTALRSIKLGLLQMMTPIILGAYIFKEDILKRWALEYIKTFVQVFLLLVSISLMTKVLSLLPNITEKVGSSYSNNWLLAGIINVLSIMAMLRLVKQIIPLVNKIFGTNIAEKGGIRGRLGEMAAVGNLAQRAWDSFRQNPVRALTAPVSAIGGMAAHGVAVGARARELWGRGERRGAILAGLGGALTIGGAGIRGARQGWQHGNIRAIGAQGRRYEETHRTGSTLGGRLMDDFRETMGIESREAVMARNAERASKARTALTTSQQQAQQLATSEYCNIVDANGNNAYQIAQQISAMRDGAPKLEEFVQYEDITDQYGFVIGQRQVTDNAGNPVFDRQAFQAAQQQHLQDVQHLQDAYNALVNQASTQILNTASAGGNMSAFLNAAGQNSIQARDLASAIGNSITEQIGIYGANLRMEQVGTHAAESLERIGNGTLGTQMEQLIYGNGIPRGQAGSISGVDRILQDYTQFYDSTGIITERGAANADQRSRDSRYVDNAAPQHGGNNGGNNH